MPILCCHTFKSARPFGHPKKLGTRRTAKSDQTRGTPSLIRFCCARVLLGGLPIDFAGFKARPGPWSAPRTQGYVIPLSSGFGPVAPAGLEPGDSDGKEPRKDSGSGPRGLFLFLPVRRETNFSRCPKGRDEFLLPHPKFVSLFRAPEKIGLAANSKIESD